MAWTIEQLQAVEEAIATGALRVRYADREVTYHSTADLLRIRNLMRAALGLAPAGGTTSSYPTFSKGLE